ncbi:tyrosine-type recombinase/integrase [Williamsia muralis]|uniref:Site-specific integrase n=1 Tax=Williamsia marianensis TaxID=85044 RepID=A0ABU4EXC8_WILMA|nr:site-specific integrase [Williamsia muralis]MDV7135411.1 site-specific integrase [Williamsia muralis]
MAHVQKRTKQDGSPAYVVKWRTPDGKQRSKGGFSTRRAADDYATSIDYNQRRGTTFDPKSGGMTFRDAAAIWLESRHDLKPRTRTNYAGHLRPGGDIDTTFGGYPLNKITRAEISTWVNAHVAADKSASAVRNAFFIVRMVLKQAVVDGRLTTNPAEYVKLPSPRAKGSTAGPRTHGSVEDTAAFLTAEQVDYLADASPWPYNVFMHLAAWSGLRSAEMGGLQIGDLELSRRGGAVQVRRTVMIVDNRAVYDSPKTRRSRRRVPLTARTVGVLADYLASHPRRNDLTAPLFPNAMLVAPKPTGKRAPKHPVDTPFVDRAGRSREGEPMTPGEQAALLSVAEAQDRLNLDWSEPLHHKTFYKSVYQPAILRACLVLSADGLAPIPANATAHSLRHSYASFCVSAGLHPKQIADYMGHASVNTTMGVYAHLFEDDHDDAMAALGGVAAPRPSGNVVRLRG